MPQSLSSEVSDQGKLNLLIFVTSILFSSVDAIYLKDHRISEVQYRENILRRKKSNNLKLNKTIFVCRGAA